MTPAHVGTSDQKLHRYTVDGIDVVERPGSGCTVMFLHGIGANSTSFADVMVRFPTGPRLLAWDAPGYLRSAVLDTAFPSAADYARVLERLLDGLAVERAHVVGHSLGTLIAVALAVLAPDRIASLTLAATAQGYGVTPGAALPPKAAKRLDDLDALGPKAFAAARADSLLYKPDQDPDSRARVQSAMEQINPAGYAQAVHMLASGNLARDIQRVTVQPGFIIGEQDQITPHNQTKSATHAWQQAHGSQPNCIAIPDAGHAVYVQAPKAFIDAILTLAPEIAQGAAESPKGVSHVG